MSAKFPQAYEFLFKPARYKVAYGGRGGGKSQNFARALLVLGAQRSLRILCCRETQKSLVSSVHQLLADQIIEMGLSDRYTVENTSIKGTRNNTEFIFSGLKDAAAIKSLESVCVAWVEEAQSISKHSLGVLIPTIRKADCAIYSDAPKDSSEIWFSYNPQFFDDPCHELFVVNDPPPDSIVKFINYDQNPFFPETLRKESEFLKAKDPDEWAHIYGGQCIQTLKGSVYENELRVAEAEGRITKVPYDSSRPVHCFFDIGYGDSTAIWFAQAYMAEYRLIDYLEDRSRDIRSYLKEMQGKRYLYGTLWLPWDGGTISMVSGKSIQDVCRESGFRVRSLPQTRVHQGINAVRGIFPNCWFDAKNCATGLNMLRKYRFGENVDAKTRTREPVHDAASHGSDAFRTFACAIQQPKNEAETARQKTIHQPQRAALPATPWS